MPKRLDGTIILKCVPESNNCRPPIRSFVRRSTRMTTAQSKAWRDLRADYVISFGSDSSSVSLPPDTSLDWTAIFGRDAPLVVEIGSGTGESLVTMAAAHLETNFVAFEVFEPALASTLARLSQAELSNVRLIATDGAIGLKQLIPDSKLSALWTFFPDPWHKLRHHKRRLISDSFAALVTTKLCLGGRWLIATDWDDYREQIVENLANCPKLKPIAVELVQNRPFGRPETKYERRGIAAGRAIYELAYEKVLP